MTYGTGISTRSVQTIQLISQKQFNKLQMAVRTWQLHPWTSLGKLTISALVRPRCVTIWRTVRGLQVDLDRQLKPSPQFQASRTIVRHEPKRGAKTDRRHLHLTSITRRSNLSKSNTTSILSETSHTLQRDKIINSSIAGNRGPFPPKISWIHSSSKKIITHSAWSKTNPKASKTTTSPFSTINSCSKNSSITQSTPTAHSKVANNSISHGRPTTSNSLIVRIGSIRKTWRWWWIMCSRNSTRRRKRSRWRREGGCHHQAGHRNLHIWPICRIYPPRSSRNTRC